jgi:hypothetical protein
MEIVCATITGDGGKVIAADVEVSIIETPDRLHGWHGVVVSRRVLDVEAGSGPYLLKTKDGRSGQIVVSKIKPSFMGPGSELVEFDGAGPFGRCASCDFPR